MSFVGTYTHALDAKNRIFIPAKFREKLGDTFYITRKLTTKSLVIYPEDEWIKKGEAINEIADSVGEDIKEQFYSEAIDPIPDSQGRVTLTPALIKYAKITKNVVISGYGSYIQIWPEEVWEERQKEQQAEERMKRIQEMTLRYNL